MSDEHPEPESYQRRTIELEALFETAGELSSLHHVDAVLGAIVQRSRQLLASDVAYLMLLDEARRQTYMRVSEGIQTQEFHGISLDYGEGLGGLVASTGMPQWTRDYRSDERFAPKIGEVVRAEALTALLGVPLKVGGRVRGVLFAADRRSRDFTHREIALLTSLANHAAIALDNAELHEQTQQVLEKWQSVSRKVAEQNRTLERASEFHERLTGLVAAGVPLGELAEAVAQFLRGAVAVLADDGTLLTPVRDAVELPTARELAAVSDPSGSGSAPLGEGVESGSGRHVVVARTGARRLGYLFYEGPVLSSTDVRSLERAALVTALTILHKRADEEARSRVMGELMAELAVRPGGDEAWLHKRAAAVGITVSGPPYAAVSVLESAESGGLDRLDAVVRTAREYGGLARAQEGEISLLVGGEDPSALARRISADLEQRLHTPVAAGAAGPYPTLCEAARALPRARTCAGVLAMTGRWSQGAAPEDVGLYTLLFSEAGRERIEEFVAETLGPVLEHDGRRDGRLLETLRAHFDHGSQTGAVSAALMIHVNTLYQRQERIDGLLGPGWRRGEQSLQVHLAVRLRDLLRGTG